MSFYFANPWGLLALLSIPTIVAIHMFHHRYPPLLIAGAHLWGAEMRMTSAGRRRQRLPITATLLLELLAALILSLLLANPTFGDLGKVRHLVVVLDSSASMQAAPAGEASFRDQAVAEIQRRMSASDRNTVVTLIATGRRVKKLAGPVGWEEARLALAQWQPTETHHDFALAWDRAAQVAEGTGELLFLTDHLAEVAADSSRSPYPKELEVVSFGRKLENVGLTAARWDFDSQAAQGKLFLRLHNFGTRPASVTIHGDVAGERLFSRSVDLNPDAAAPAEIPMPGGTGEITVTLESEGDALEFDNRVVLVEPKVTRLKVDLALSEESSAYRTVEKALAAIPDLELISDESPHLVIAPAAELPPSDVRTWWLGIGPIDLAESAAEQARDLLGPYLLQKQHPLLTGVVLGGIVWGGVQETDIDCVPIISSGKSTLLGQLVGTSTTAYLMNIDFRRSNLGESPDWPILLLNLLDSRRQALPGLRQWNYRLNEDVQFRMYEGTLDPAGAEPPPLTLNLGETRRELVRGSTVFISGLEQTGVYELRDGDRPYDRFAVNFFDPAESDLTALTPGRHAAEEPVVELFVPDDPYSWLIMLGTLLIMACMFCDWYVLSSPAQRKKEVARGDR